MRLSMSNTIICQKRKQKVYAVHTDYLTTRKEDALGIKQLKKIADSTQLSRKNF